MHVIELGEALFEVVDHERYRATELARGPWDPDALHGGPPGALIAGALEAEIIATDLGVDFFPARLTVELVRPVPLDVLTVTTVVRRPGRRICIADGEIAGPDGRVCLRATLSGIRRAPFDHGRSPTDEVPPPPDSGHGLAPSTISGPRAFHNVGTEHRLVSGTAFEAPGPAIDWIRLAAPVVAGREPTPLERTIAAADFGNGVSGWFPMDQVLFLNPDLSVHLHRLPAGEWVGLDAVTRLGADGVATAESLLFDLDGPIGRATQSLLVEPR